MRLDTKSTMDDLNDEKLLNNLGYRQDMERHFSKWSTLSYSMSILGVSGSVPATIGTSLNSGGTGTAVWAWFVGSVFSNFVAHSVAELVSAYPTAGGMYFVTSHVVPPKHSAIWSWVIGWLNLLGQSAGVASVAFTVSQMILAAASLCSKNDGVSYAFVPTALQTVLLSISVLIFQGLICSFSTRLLHKTILWFAPINIASCLVICVTLLASTPAKASAVEVFGNFTDGSGWGSKGWSFFLGFASVAWTMTDYDATTHMSEETHQAARRGPQAIRLAVFLSSILGWLLTITICFCASDLTQVLGSPSGLPAAQVFFNIGTRRGAALWSLAIIVQFFTGCAAMLGDTRMAYAFARDEALPLSHLWSRINSRTSTPINAVWLVVVFTALMNCIGIGSTQTVVAIFNVTAPALDLSYVAVIFARMLYSKQVIFQPGPFSLGRYGRFVNIVSIVYVIFISIVLLFPSIRPITRENFNYAMVVAAFIGFASTLWWFAGANRRYTGPRTLEARQLDWSEAGSPQPIDAKELFSPTMTLRSEEISDSPKK